MCLIDPQTQKKASVSEVCYTSTSAFSAALMTVAGLSFNLSLAHSISPIFNHLGIHIFEYAHYAYGDGYDNSTMGERRPRVYFDSTWLTYGTDYLIAATMAAGILFLMRSAPRSSVRSRSVGMVACYLTSVLVGGFAHHKLHSISSLNSLSFRAAWIVCVGTVTSAAGFIGSIGSAIHREYPLALAGAPPKFSVPKVPDWVSTLIL
mmetsp:Transcript_36201/g.84657  ORF Transcript_36201/g.84657 Transcript_36201/m.84657 type:complete len:206 (+) Transcript_36201:251-868(+)